MSILQSIFLGIVQGITEFLPVSSSGHLAILQNIFNIDTEGGLLFDVMLHVGTLVAVCVVYWKDIWRMIREAIWICVDLFHNLKTWLNNRKYDQALRYRKIVKNNYRKFVVLVILSTIPTGIIGFVSRDLVGIAGQTLIVPGVCLILTGVLLIVADISEDGHKVPKDVSYSNGFFIGICQGISTLPGLSRSGTTIAACLMSGFDRRFAVKYSFIMSVPAILGAAVLELKDIGSETVTAGLVGTYFAGAVAAGLVGYICIKTMLVVVRKKKFKGFAIYCFAVGVLAIVGHFIIY